MAAPSASRISLSAHSAGCDAVVTISFTVALRPVGILAASGRPPPSQLSETNDVRASVTMLRTHFQIRKTNWYCARDFAIWVPISTIVVTTSVSRMICSTTELAQQCTSPLEMRHCLHTLQNQSRGAIEDKLGSPSFRFGNAWNPWMLYQWKGLLISICYDYEGVARRITIQSDNLPMESHSEKWRSHAPPAKSVPHKQSLTP